MRSAIFHCLYDGDDCEKHGSFGLVPVVGYGLSELHTCIRFNSTKIVARRVGDEYGLSISFLLPANVSSVIKVND